MKKIILFLLAILYVGYARRSSRQQTASMYWKYSAGTTMVPVSMGRRMCPTPVSYTHLEADRNFQFFCLVKYFLLCFLDFGIDL